MVISVHILNGLGGSLGTQDYVNFLATICIIIVTGTDLNMPSNNFLCLSPFTKGQQVSI